MKLWQVVFRKEFFEVLRDPRSRFTLFISPLLITPLFLAGIGSMVRNRAKEAKTEHVQVAYVNMRSAPTLRALLDKAPNFDIQEMSKAEAEQQILKRKLTTALVVPDDAEEKIKTTQTANLSILTDKGWEASQEAASRLQSLIDERGKRLVASRLMENGFSQQLATPFTTPEEAIKGGANAGTLFLATLLPYLMALTALMGGINVANDSIAGEKERGTLETLLVSPVSRRNLVLGKFMAVCGVSIVCSLLSLVGLIWPFYAKISMFAWMSDAGISLRPIAIMAILLVQIPLTVLSAGLLLTVSTFAHNQKEAQTYLTPLIIVMTALSMVTIAIKADAPLYWAAIPVTNAALVVKQGIEGTVNPAFLILAIVTSLLYATVAVLVAAHAFQKESILLKA